MNLFCCETYGDENNAYDDPNLLQDRVLRNLLRTEEKYVLPSNISFESTQREVTLHMRKIVAEWMLEVCEEQECQDTIFSLAMICMDRFLNCCSIHKNQLQLLGTACLLISAKLRASRPLAADTLVYYTDHSVTKELLSSWELLVLSKLKWDVSAITPQDFLKHLLTNIDIEAGGISFDIVNKHARTIITLCSREFVFAKYHPSLIACASIASALCGLNWPSKSRRSKEDLLEKLTEITHIEKEYIETCMRQIDEMMQEIENKIDEQVNECENVLRPDEFTPPPLKNQEHETALTPTDVQNVHF